MTSKFERFWDHETYMIIGNNKKAPFPTLSLAALVAKKKKVLVVDPGEENIGEHKAYPDIESAIASLTDNNDSGDGGAGDAQVTVDAAILEVPKKESMEWVEKIADAGINNLWIHMGRETPEAIRLAEERGLNLCHGTCAVLYLDNSFPHSLHAWFRKILGNY